jgi:hypothetical protein
MKYLLYANGEQLRNFNVLHSWYVTHRKPDNFVFAKPFTWFKIIEGLEETLIIQHHINGSVQCVNLWNTNNFMA